LAIHTADGSPRNPGRPAAAPSVLTVDYQPPQDRTDGPRVALVASSGPGATALLARLLRRRLLFLSFVFAVLSGLVSLIFLRDLVMGKPLPPGWWWVRTNIPATFVATAVLGGILWRRKVWTVRHLRVIELEVFGVVVLCFLIESYKVLWLSGTLSHAVELIDQEQFARASFSIGQTTHTVYMPWALIIVAYGVLIPNRWRRCALVVGLMALAAIVLRTTAYVTSGLPLNNWSLAGTYGGVLLLCAVAIAIYGAHRIEGLQQEALEARKLGQYQLQGRLGAGGMGEVHLAEHVLLRRPCALKLIRRDRASDPQHLRRFEREVKATATLAHPNIVQVYDYGHTDDGTFYYVMEYLPGLTLEQLVEQHGPLLANRAVHFLRQVCGALSEAHAIGLIHRDVKPSNVMVCERGGRHDTVKLLDFGLVIPLGGGPGDEKLTREGALAGSPAYMSPEQAGGQDEVDARSDIYSVGALAYFLLTGQPPFAGRSSVKMLAAHLYEPPAPLGTYRPEVAADLEAVVLKCLAKVPADRYPDVRTLDAALAACDPGGQWTEQDATQWWNSRADSEARTGSSQGHEGAVPNQALVRHEVADVTAVRSSD
jgi:serine/threonine-protein kinase